jgi:hypothetical protein
MTSNVKFLTAPIHKVFLLIFFRQLKIFFENKHLVFTSIFLFISSLCILKFLQGNFINFETFKVIEILLIIYSINLSSKLILLNDYKKELFEQFILTGIILEYFIISKIIASIVFYAVLYTILTILFDLMSYGLNNYNILQLILIKIFTVINIVVNSIFSSSFLLSFEKKVSQILISIFVNIPTIIISVLCYVSNDWVHILLLGAVFCLTIAITIIVSSYLIKISIEDS